LSPKVRFVIAGTGAIAPSHAEAIRRLNNAELVAFLGNDPHRTDFLSKKYGVKGYNRWEKLCQGETFDAVAIATHTGRHFEIGLEAASRGKHLLIEKPITMTLEEGEGLIESCQRSGVTLGVVYQHRFDPDIQRLKRWLETGALGTVLWASVSLPLHRDPSYYREHEGRSDLSLTGGGVLVNQGIHFIDLFQWLFGPVSMVYGHTEGRFHQVPFEDTATALLQCASGVLITVAATTAASLSKPSRIEIHGSQGSILMENCMLKQFIRQGRLPGKIERVWRRVRIRFRKRGSHEKVFHDFSEAVLKGRSPCVDGKEALKSLQIVLGIYEASRSGKPVFLGREVFSPFQAIGKSLR